MAYQDRLLLHLASYKRSVLGVDEPGIFHHQGRALLRDHILPASLADFNLLPLARAMEPAFRDGHPGVRRHPYFHHLNSSQAFTFNLFLPFLDRGGPGAAALLRPLGSRGQLRSWQLEAVPDDSEGSNLDVLWTTDDGLCTICEVKLSEAEFGTAADDSRHREKLEAIYRPALKGCVDPALLEAPAFFGAYQVLRNVWHLVRMSDNRLVFLLPRANESLWSALPLILGRIAPPVRRRITTVAIEDLLRLLFEEPSCPSDLRMYAGELAAKYLPNL